MSDAKKRADELLAQLKEEAGRVGEWTWRKERQFTCADLDAVFDVAEEKEKTIKTQANTIEALAAALVIARKGLTQRGQLEGAQWAQIDLALQRVGRLP